MELLIIIMIVMYFVPTIIAFNRGSTSAFFIFILNVLLGWLILPWFIALALSISGETWESRAKSKRDAEMYEKIMDRERMNEEMLYEEMMQRKQSKL